MLLKDHGELLKNLSTKVKTSVGRTAKAMKDRDSQAVKAVEAEKRKAAAAAKVAAKKPKVAKQTPEPEQTDLPVLLRSDISNSKVTTSIPIFASIKDLKEAFAKDPYLVRKPFILSSVPSLTDAGTASWAQVSFHLFRTQFSQCGKSRGMFGNTSGGTFTWGDLGSLYIIR